MRALQFAEYGPPDVLSVVELPEPHAGPGRVRIDVRAVGINPADAKQRQGLMKGKLPRTTGLEAAGVVDEVGEGVTDVAVGDAVFGSAAAGAAADRAVLSAYAVKPASMSFEQAAALPVAVETAVRGLEILGASSGQTLLVNAATGGVGTAVVQLARSRGLTVIGTASPANHDYLRRLGGVPTTYGSGLPARVRELAAGGVDIAFDAGGRGALAELVEIVGSTDRVVTIADYPGAQELGVRFTGGMGGEPRAWHALAEAAALFDREQFSIEVARTFRLEDGAEAHRVIEEGHVRGKLVFLLDEPRCR